MQRVYAPEKNKKLATSVRDKYLSVRRLVSELLASLDVANAISGMMQSYLAKVLQYNVARN